MYRDQKVSKGQRRIKKQRYRYNPNDNVQFEDKVYRVMGIPEYWIVDYLALGGREFIGNPKQPTISVCSLQEGEYRVSKFRGDDRVQSPTFPELTLTAQQIFDASA